MSQGCTRIIFSATGNLSHPANRTFIESIVWTYTTKLSDRYLSCQIKSLNTLRAMPGLPNKNAYIMAGV